jgi:hypothetical protein
MTSQLLPRSRSRIPRLLGIIALLAVLGLGTLVVAFYEVPWGGRFNASIAGPVSEWVGDLFTALGILGLIYQLSQLRLSRVDETTREINSLYTYISTKMWQRGRIIDGKLVYVYLQNDGERKAMDVSVSATLSDGQPIPENWIIERQDCFSLPPSTIKPVRVLVFHVPAERQDAAFGTSGQPTIRIRWTDPWRRRVEMTNNMPSLLIGQDG